SRISARAIVDLPLPDSPTSASVSPLPTSKLTASTATTSRPPLSYTAVRCFTESSGLGSLFLILAEAAAHRISDLAHGGFCFDGVDDARNEVLGAPCRGSDGIERRSPAGRVAAGAHGGDACLLRGFERRVDPQHLGRRGRVGHVAVDAD